MKIDSSLDHAAIRASDRQPVWTYFTAARLRERLTDEELRDLQRLEPRGPQPRVPLERPSLGLLIYGDEKAQVTKKFVAIDWAGVD